MSRKALNTWKGCLWQDGALWPPARHTWASCCCPVLGDPKQPWTQCWLVPHIPALLASPHTPWEKGVLFKRQPRASLNTKHDIGISGGYRHWFHKEPSSYTCRPRLSAQRQTFPGTEATGAPPHAAAPLFNFRDLNV